MGPPLKATNLLCLLNMLILTDCYESLHARRPISLIWLLLLLLSLQRIQTQPGITSRQFEDNNQHELVISVRHHRNVVIKETPPLTSIAR